MMQPFVIPQLANRAGWTLVHFLWQGALIATVTAGVLRLLSGRTAQARYVVGVGALFTMIAVPAATFAFYAQAGSVLRGMMLRIATAMDPAVLSRAASATVLSSHDSQWTTWVACLWLAGVAMSSIRIVVGWRVTRQLVQTASDAVPDSVKQAFLCMKTRMAVVRPVKLLLSERIDGPAAIGWLKPVVLLPLTAITGLDPAQLQAVLAHELAHIRRHDFFVNVLQQCVESLLFYHPAVWWLSRRIRVEREHVCDDLAVAACGDPAVYAKALVELERNRSNVPSLAMAAARGSLKARIRRIFGWTPEGRDWREAATAAMFVLTLLVAVAWQTRTIEAQSISVHVTQVFTPSVLPPEAQPAPTPATMLAATLASLAPSPAISAQQTAIPNPQAKVRIEGVVVNANSGEPIEGAHVTFAPVRTFTVTNAAGAVIADQEAFVRGSLAVRQASGLNSIATDSQGRFIADDLDSGSYRISVAAGGFVHAEYGQRSPDGPGLTLTLDPGKSIRDLSIRMTPASTISVLIRNDRGRPVVDVPVQLLKATYNATGQRLTQVVGLARTDDRGLYRLYWVTPGRYYLNAGSEPSASGPRGGVTVRAPVTTNDPDETYGLTFYPGVSDISAAKLIEVGSDAQVSADLVVTARTLYKVSGRVIDTTTGKPAASALLSLVYRNLDGSSDTFARGSTYNAATGDFELRNVPSGSYDVQATIMQLTGLSPLATAAQATGITYSLSTGNTPVPTGNFISSASGRGRAPITITWRRRECHSGPLDQGKDNRGRPTSGHRPGVASPSDPSIRRWCTHQRRAVVNAFHCRRRRKLPHRWSEPRGIPIHDIPSSSQLLHQGGTLWRRRSAQHADQYFAWSNGNPGGRAESTCRTSGRDG
jgi:beta-lactamase regulating signal transducer with metallopeptidase domain